MQVVIGQFFLSSLCYLAHLDLISQAGFLGLVLVEGAELPPLPLLVEVAHLHRQLVLGGVDGEALPTAAVAESPRLQERERAIILGPVKKFESVDH